MVNCQDIVPNETPRYGGEASESGHIGRSQFGLYRRSIRSHGGISVADQLLRQETLSLDVEPAFIELPPIVLSLT